MVFFLLRHPFCSISTIPNLRMSKPPQPPLSNFVSNWDKLLVSCPFWLLPIKIWASSACLFVRAKPHVSLQVSLPSYEPFLSLLLSQITSDTCLLSLLGSRSGWVRPPEFGSCCCAGQMLLILKQTPSRIKWTISGPSVFVCVTQPQSERERGVGGLWMICITPCSHWRCLHVIEDWVAAGWSSRNTWV